MNREKAKERIDAYIPDNQFRSRDPKFQDQRIKHPKPSRGKPKEEQTIPSDEFILDEKQLTCECPEGHMLSLRRQRKDKKGNDKVFFEGMVSQCRDCKRKNECMRNPKASNPSNGRGRHVSFIIQQAEQPPNYTDWMKGRIDSDKGKKYTAIACQSLAEKRSMQSLHSRHPWRSARIRKH